MHTDTLDIQAQAHWERSAQKQALGKLQRFHIYATDYTAEKIIRSITVGQTVDKEELGEHLTRHPDDATYIKANLQGVSLLGTVDKWWELDSTATPPLTVGCTVDKARLGEHLEKHPNP